MKYKQISIVGSGWLGNALGLFLQQKGFIIKTSTTTAEKSAALQELGMQPYVFKLGETKDDSVLQEFMHGSDILIINFPPKRKIENIEEVYPVQVAALIPHIKSHQKIIFISSTSVYQNTNTWVQETLEVFPEKASGKAVLGAERKLNNAFGNQVSILRLSGLIGYDRLPGRFLANKTNLKNGKTPINVIHRDDCIGLIYQIIQKDFWGEIINGCADEHPLREKYYTLAAEKIGLTPPQFLQEEAKVAYKMISNEKSKLALGYEYQHPNPLKLL